MDIGACGQCRETAIRQDEQLAVRTLRAVPAAAESA